MPSRMTTPCCPARVCSSSCRGASLWASSFSAWSSSSSGRSNSRRPTARRPGRSLPSRSGPSRGGVQAPFAFSIATRFLRRFLYGRGRHLRAKTAVAGPGSPSSPQSSPARARHFSWGWSALSSRRRSSASCGQRPRWWPSATRSDCPIGQYLIVTLVRAELKQIEPKDYRDLSSIFRCYLTGVTIGYYPRSASKLSCTRSSCKPRPKTAVTPGG
jgi:hypothetical protein